MHIYMYSYNSVSHAETHTATHCNNIRVWLVRSKQGQADAASRCSRGEHTLQHALYHKLQHTLQHTATQYSTLHHNATHCNALQRTATHCNALQHTATHCNTQQRVHP